MWHVIPLSSNTSLHGHHTNSGALIHCYAQAACVYIYPYYIIQLFKLEENLG